MSDSTTPNYGLTLCEVGADSDNWGQKLNANFTAVDTAMEANATAAQKAETDAQTGITNAAAAQATANAAGYRGIPSNPQNAAYTLAATDNGGDVPNTQGGITIQTDANVPLPSGFVSGVYNDSATPITITPANGVTMRIAGTTTSGPRNLAGYGYATIKRIRADLFVIMGGGLS